MGCVPGVLTRVLTSQTSCAATVERLLWKGCFVVSGLVPDGVSPPCDSLKSLAIQSTEIRYASPEFLPGIPGILHTVNVEHVG